MLLTAIVIAYVVLYAFAFQLNPPWNLLEKYGKTAQQAISISTDVPLDHWLEEQEHIAIDKLLANVAPKGHEAQNAAWGTVIASPSRDHPNYFFQWIRDASITMSTLVDMYAKSPSADLSLIISAFVTLQYKIQHIDNPSGGFDDLAGLGEPKFLVNGSPFNRNWGRPQRDGPALRALALMAFLRAYNATHPDAWTEPDRHRLSILYDPSMPPNSLIKADLEYVSRYWSIDGFDVWEEVYGLHFFTAMVQLRALREGVGIAIAFGDFGAAKWYDKQARKLSAFLHEFWSEERNHLIAIKNTARSGLDCALLLGSLHGESEIDMPWKSPYPPHSDEVLLSLLALTHDQAIRHPINEPHRVPISGFAAAGLGRYPEDIYDGYGTTPNGGNPWFLCTSSAAEVMFRTASHLLSQHNLPVTALGLPFWSGLLSNTSSIPDLKAGIVYNSSSEVFKTAMERLKSIGDDFLYILRTHANADGSLSEQFDRVTGFERGAHDLTWSYGAFLQAYWARKRLVAALIPEK
ncbi:hypothetical protein EJ05DRAFT_443389 [Pseudovirgaria hyperparasitica]|uniref:glucan 1,4-alpha-glucosidase n=1 Tax=Pseudovirgaria hyperparasitica TaxID=470096 RepID=A0A6A6VYI7_9PEZI|nr:uncharacterized protein EJ05DRAFT_443389 [Pseudovirgaria hyperparasitica]KAF2754367.1 hypothetical protein EJ05DRAFT_443389 [Pseudovirgaria hyperparasitica]